MMVSLGEKDKDSPYKIRMKKQIIYKHKGSSILYFDLDHESEQKNVDATNDDLYLLDSNQKMHRLVFKPDSVYANEFII